MTPTTARVIYPELPDPLTQGDLYRLFNPSFDERKWAPAIARTPTSQVALLVQLKIFQTIGRFLGAADVPPAAVEYVASRICVESVSKVSFPKRTLYRHRPIILERLKVISWGPQARALAQATMRKTAQARTDPAVIINSAIDALIRHGFELPALATLRRLAGAAHSDINAAQWNDVCGRLSSEQRTVLETLLVVDPKTQKSPFASLCATPGRASRKNLNALVDRYQWLQQLPNPTAPLQSIADSKVSQWANEAKRLNALELREYITPRRHTLLMAVIHDVRAHALDDLTQMLLRLARKIEWKSEQRLAEWYQSRHNKTDTLIRAFRDSLIVHGSEIEPVQKVLQVENLFEAKGGRDALAQSCAEHLRHERQNWRPFSRPCLCRYAIRCCVW